MNSLISSSILTQILLKVVLTILGGVIGLALARKAVNLALHNLKKESRLASYRQRIGTVQTLIHNLLFLFFLFVVVLMVMRDLGFDITPLLTGAGIAGLAISFGAQTLVRDLISGLLIILENQYNVGDEVKIAGHHGTIHKINLRTTVLKDQDDNTIYIPNSEIKKVVVLKK